ncbi:MAG: DUF4105 domain-containing protein [Cyclobacteriaceae bacterium]|nr:DUF4105 domain-containing protein [Cyclobacteriaceae bacterium]
MRKLSAFILFFISGFVSAQTTKLSERATISVITCGPFQQELYSAFGHSAIRVFDASQGIDEGYNYGVFDFDRPNFYLNFARGFLYYNLGVYDYPRFRDFYIYHNRYIHEQVLNLSQEQKQKLFDYLRWNAQPENQFYRYDYFYNNCATKIRDVIKEVLGDDVTFDGSYITTDYTIRDLTDIYLQQQPWGDLGIDICLGLPMDKKASPYEYMFLPDYIESGFDHATLKRDSVIIPIVKEKISIYESREEDLPAGLPHPLLVFSIVAVCIIAISIWDVKRKKLSSWLDVILFGATGVVGMLLFFLWFFTDHNAAANNLNILWAIPTHLVAVVALIRSPAWLAKYFLITALIQGILLLGWFIMPQQLNVALIPIVIALLLRAFLQFQFRPRAG